MAIVPHTWVNENEQHIYCFWPNYFKSNKEFTKAVISKEELNPDDCEICSVNIKCKTSKSP